MRSQVAPRTIWTVGLNALLLAGLGWVLVQAWTVLSWVLLGLLLALALEPGVAALETRGMRRAVAVALLAVLLLGLGTALAASFVPLVVAQAHSLATEVPHLLEGLKQHAWVSWADQRFGILSDLSARIRGEAPQAAAIGLGLLRRIVSGILAATTIVTVALFALLFGREAADWIVEWIRPEEHDRVERLLGQIRAKVGGYVAGVLLLSVLAGLVTSVTTLILGVPYFLALGLAMGVLTLVPIVGATVGTVLAIATTLAAKGIKSAIIVLVVGLVYPWVKNHAIAPLIMRRTIQMNPLVITIVVLVGVAAGGLLGIVLALPVAGVVQVLLEEVKTRHRSRFTPPQGQLPGSDQKTPL